MAANFDFENSVNRRRILAQKAFSRYFWYLTSLNGLIFILIIFLFFRDDGNSKGLSQILLAIILFLESYFLAKRYGVFTKKNSENSADFLSADLVSYLEKALVAAEKEGIYLLSPEYLFLKLPVTFAGKLIFNRLLLSSEVPVGPKTAQKATLSDELKQILSQFIQEKRNDLSVEELALCLFNNSEKIQKFLKENKIEKDEFLMVISWVKEIELSINRKKFYEDETVLAGVGQEWSYGYTPVLSMYSHDLSKYFNDPNLEINTFGHTNILSEIETILVKTGKNNVLLVGEPGVGKKTIINSLANKVAKGDCLGPLKYKRIRQLDTGRLLAGAGRGELEARLEQVLTDAVSSGNMIIYIDNFESLIGGGSGENTVGSVDATGIILPFLENANLQFVASITPDSYFNKARANSSLVNAFEKIEVNPPAAKETLGILLESLSLVEFKYHVFFPLITLKKIVELADRYIHDVPFPEKALRLLNEAAVNLGSERVKLVMPEEIEALISKKTNVPVGEVGETEKDKLLNLESFLHQRVIGQNEAVLAVADSLRRVRSGLTTGKRPAGVFLFLGPTGVGKTETAKALAESYFGSEKKMIRLDMSEYQESNSIGRLVGTMENPGGILTNAILEDPFSLILLDEIEKADKNILNIFLQVFEDGRLTDPQGRVSDFTNAIIIATSNAGSEMIREAVDKNQATNLKENLVEFLQTNGIFTPEFLNRFDGVVVFKPLTSAELGQIAQLMINQINNTLKGKQITITVAPDALAKLVELGYDPQFGARPMRRVIQQKIENLLAKKMLEGEVKEGDTFQINLNDVS